MDKNNLVKEMLEMARKQLEQISETSTEEKILLLREVNAQLAQLVQLSRDEEQKKKPSTSKRRKFENEMPASNEKCTQVADDNVYQKMVQHDTDHLEQEVLGEGHPKSATPQPDVAEAEKMETEEAAKKDSIKHSVNAPHLTTFPGFPLATKKKIFQTIFDVGQLRRRILPKMDENAPIWGTILKNCTKEADDDDYQKMVERATDELKQEVLGEGHLKSATPQPDATEKMETVAKELIPPAFPKKVECKPQPKVEHEPPDGFLFYPLPVELCIRELVNRLEGPRLENKKWKPFAESKTEAKIKGIEEEIPQVYCSCACFLKFLDSIKGEAHFHTDLVSDPESLCNFTANQSEVLRAILTGSSED